MEMLRIVAMSMILIHHFMRHGLDRALPNDLYYLLDIAVYYGVNLFFLVSGHFLIKTSLKSITKICLIIIFFGLVNLIISAGCGEIADGKTWIKAIVYPISGSPYWFMKEYILLLITAPFINTALKTIPLRQYRNALIIFTVAIIYMRDHVASYNYLNGLYFYCLAHYLRRADFAMRFSKRTFMLVFIAITAAGAITSYLLAPTYYYFFLYFDSYDTPFMILGAASLYLYFCRLSFSSRFVNSVAGAAFGCYLLQDGFLGNSVIYPLQLRFAEQYGYGLSLLAMFAGWFVIFWCASYLLTRLQGLWLQPLTNGIVAILHKAAARLRLL